MNTAPITSAHVSPNTVVSPAVYSLAASDSVADIVKAMETFGIYIRGLMKTGNDELLHDDRETFTLDEFCGVVPRVGDSIVSRWLRPGHGEDPMNEGRLWHNRTVMEVVSVYFRPDKRDHDHDDCWVCVVVKKRQMKEAEWNLL